VPVVLKPDVWPSWLGEEPTDRRQLQALLAPYPAEKMTCWPVSARIGNVRNNDASLIELSRRNDWLATVFVISALVGCAQVTPGRNKQRRTVQIRRTTTTGVTMAAGGGGM
jgi:SOS response associated peptidase (SRAP)